MVLWIGILCSYSGVQAQVIKRIREKFEQKVERVVDKALNPVAKTTDKDEHSTNQSSSTGPFKTIPVMAYDFNAGSKIIFFDDFSEDTLGVMADRWTSNGTGAISTVEGFDGHWLKLSDRNTYKIKELVRIPENFTLEFEVLAIAEHKDGLRINFGFDHQKGVGKYNPLAYRNPINIETAFRFDRLKFTSNEVHPSKKSEIKTDLSYFVNDVMQVKIRVQGDRMSAYIGQYKVLDTEMVDPLTKKYFYIAVENKENLGQIYLGNVRITEI